MLAKPLEQGWHAELKLRFVATTQKTILAQRQHYGPLAIQRPFYPEGSICHAYILHPPGGIAGGDALHIQATLEPKAHALLTTPGASKFYRSTGLLASQQQHFLIKDSYLEFLPQENIFFPSANACLSSRIYLEGAAAYIGWEIHCLGRPAIKETFQQGRALLKTAVYQDGKPLLLDRLAIQGEADLHSAAGLRSQPVFATLLAVPATLDALQRARDCCVNSAQGMAGATLLNGVLVVRYLGDSSAQVHHLFRQIWAAIRPLILGCQAHAPRIWAT